VVRPAKEERANHRDTARTREDKRANHRDTEAQRRKRREQQGKKKQTNTGTQARLVREVLSFGF
jgi:hypothetical protein